MTSSLGRACLFATTLTACSSTVIGGGSGTGGSPSVTTPSTSSGSSSSSSASSGTVSSSSSSSSTSGALLPCSGPDMPMPPSPCVPVDPGCHADRSVCGAFYTYGGASSFALKMVNFTLDAPSFLASGIGATYFNSYQGIAAPQCTDPSASDSSGWLLAFDGLAGKVTVGFGHAEVGSSFHFVTEDIGLIEGSAHVEPALADAPIDASCGVLATTPVDVNLPLLYPASPALNFPFRHLRFHDITLTPDHNCIGRFDADALDPAQGCAQVSGPPFVDGGSLSAYLLLEEADLSMVIGTSLCAFLAGPGYGDSSSYPTRCKRDDQGHIAFPGDWCSLNDQPATAECHDAVRFSGTFTAVGVALQ